MLLKTHWLPSMFGIFPNYVTKQEIEEQDIHTYKT